MREWGRTQWPYCGAGCGLLVQIQGARRLPSWLNNVTALPPPGGSPICAVWVWELQPTSLSQLTAGSQPSAESRG